MSPRVGERVRFKDGATRPISNFELDVGGREGVVTVADESSLCIRMDDHFPDLAEWDNEIAFALPEDDGLLNLEVIS